MFKFLFLLVYNFFNINGAQLDPFRKKFGVISKFWFWFKHPNQFLDQSVTDIPILDLCVKKLIEILRLYLKSLAAVSQVLD